jgi:hypothetical protein
MYSNVGHSATINPAITQSLVVNGQSRILATTATTADRTIKPPRLDKKATITFFRVMFAPSKR